MASTLTLLAGFGAGYVLGARAGRSRYDEIVGKARGVWQDPRVQEKAGHAEQPVPTDAIESVKKDVAAVKEGAHR